MKSLNPNRMDLLGLPDEILCAILNKLDMIDVFDSLAHLDDRLDYLIFDPVFTHHVELVLKPLISNSSIDDQRFGRVCTTILPRINSHVSKLTLDSLSLERVLAAADYPHLHTLSLINFPAETLLTQLTDATTLVRRLNEQITEFSLSICESRNKSTDRQRSLIFAMILCEGEQLCGLTFNQYVLKNPSSLKLGKRLSSSTLTKLNISVDSFNDCLYLLDGRFESLSTLVIKITVVRDSLSRRDNQRKIPQLKSFSLSMNRATFFYDEQIVPLLRRMSNLEELTLFFSALRFNSTFIDGKQLHKDVLSYLNKLQKFCFSIHTELINKDIEMKLPSRDDLRNSFIQLGYRHIDAFGDVDFVDGRAAAHIYSLPYQFKDFCYLISAFRGGKFDHVRLLVMFDRRPFEHRLFQIIARDFPTLQILFIFNVKRQQDKDCSCAVITFYNLSRLVFGKAHTDYAMEFLCNENVSLPRLTTLSITYEALSAVTNNFTNDQARLICNRITSLNILEPFVRPNNFHLFFPLL